MRIGSKRLQSLLIVLAVLFGGCLTTLAGDVAERPAARDLTISYVWAKVAASIASPAGLAAALVEVDLLAPARNLLRAKFSSDGEPVRPATRDRVPQEPMLDEPVFAGGAGGDEPAGPWP